MHDICVRLAISSMWTCLMAMSESASVRSCSRFFMRSLVLKRFSSEREKSMPSSSMVTVCCLKVSWRYIWRAWSVMRELPSDTFSS